MEFLVSLKENIEQNQNAVYAEGLSKGRINKIWETAESIKMKLSEHAEGDIGGQSIPYFLFAP